MSFSTIIPAYNAEKTIERAIDSVLSQDVRGAELIVVDDGSADGTSRVVRKYGKAVRYFRQKNQGVSSARNRGLKMARRPFVAFLDADDEWLPGKLRRQLEIFSHHPEIGVVGTGVRHIDERGKVVRVRTAYRKGRLLRDFLDGNFLIISTAVVRRDLIKEMADPFQRDIFYGEDYAFWIRLAARHDFYMIPEVLVNYAEPSDASFLKKYPVENMIRAYGAVLSEAEGFCGQAQLRKIRSKMHLEIAAIHSRRGEAGLALGRVMTALWLNPLDVRNGWWIRKCAGFYSKKTFFLGLRADRRARELKAPFPGLGLNRRHRKA